MTPLVSVLIPCYNAEPWIRQTIESALSQTWRRLEVIVIDDGSSDRSLAAIEQISDSRFRFLSQRNKGQTATLNRCIAESNGEFVQFLDADDILHAEKIRTQMERLLAMPNCVAASEWARFRKDPSEAVFEPHENRGDLLPVDWLVEDLKIGGGMMFPAMWLVPRGLVEKAGPWQETLTLNNDADYFFRVVLAAEKVVFCPGARAYYRSGLPGSLSGRKSLAAWQSQVAVIENCESYLLQREDTERTRRVMSLYWQRFSHACYPHEQRMAEYGMSRARRLHSVKLPPEGGPLYMLACKVFGWRFARKLQAYTGRN